MMVTLWEQMEKLSGSLEFEKVQMGFEWGQLVIKWVALEIEWE